MRVTSVIINNAWCTFASSLGAAFFKSISKILRGRGKLSLEAEAYELLLGKRKKNMIYSIVAILNRLFLHFSLINLVKSSM